MEPFFKFTTPPSNCCPPKNVDGSCCCWHHQPCSHKLEGNMENQCATSFHPKRGLIWILIINTIPIQLGINVPIKTVNVGEICSPARWHQHSFGQRPIQRSPAPCGPRAGGLVWGFFQFSTSEVVSHGLKAGSMYVKPDDFGIFSFLNPRRLRLQVLYNAASAHTPQHLDRKDFDTC